MGFDYLQSKLNLEYQRLERLEKELSTLGDGSLHLRYDAETTYFREYNNGRQHGITKDKNKIYKLARKDVVREKILLIKKRIEVLDDAVKRLDSIENDSNIHKLIERYNMLDEKRISFSKQELEIYNNRFSKNPFNKDRLIYKTQGNVAMRSKSERFIGTLAMELFYCFRHFSRKGKQKLPKNTAKYIAIGSVCLRNKCKMPISYIFIQLLGNYLLKQLSKQQV